MITAAEAEVGLSIDDKYKAHKLAHALIDRTQEFFGGKKEFPLNEKKIVLLTLAVMLEVLLERTRLHEEEENQRKQNLS